MIAQGYSDINLLYKSQILMNLGLVFCKKIKSINEQKNLKG